MGGVSTAPQREQGFPRELLAADETILLELKPSAVPFVIAPALAMSTVLGTFLLAFALLAVESVPLAIRTCGLPLVVLALVLVLTSITGYLTWRNTFFAVTDKRVLQKSGLIGMNAFDAPLTSIQNVTLLQPFFFKLFGIGTIVFATSGTGGGAAIPRNREDRRERDVARGEHRLRRRPGPRRDEEAGPGARRAGRRPPEGAGVPQDGGDVQRGRDLPDGDGHGPAGRSPRAPRRHDRTPEKVREVLRVLRSADGGEPDVLREVRGTRELRRRG